MKSKEAEIEWLFYLKKSLHNMWSQETAIAGSCDRISRYISLEKEEPRGMNAAGRRKEVGHP